MDWGGACVGAKEKVGRVEVFRCVVRAIHWTLLFAISGCDASTESSQREPDPSQDPSPRDPEPSGGSHRAIAFTGVESLSIVSFDNPENPRQFELVTAEMSDRRLQVEWSLDGRALSVISRGEDLAGSGGFLFSSENWSLPLQPVSSFPEGLITLHWVDEDRYLAMAAGEWSFSHLRTGSITGNSAKDIDVTQWPAESGYSYLVRADETYDWIHPKRDPVRIQNADVRSFLPTNDGGDLVLVFEGDNDPEVSDTSHTLTMRAAPQAACSPSLAAGDCLPHLLGVKRVPESSLVVIAAMAQGVEGVWHAILVRGLGDRTPFSTGADEPGALRASGPDNGESCGPVVARDRIWIVCDLPEGGVHLERFESTQEGLRPAYSVDLVGADAFVLPNGEDGVLISPVDAEEGGSRESWQVLDLRHDVEAWDPVDPKGDVVVGLGRRGAIFLDSPDDLSERSTPCAPCAFTAVKDILDPKSPRLTGSFHASSSPNRRDLDFPLWPAPDGSGVLIRESGTWFYETFDKPGTRYPIATPPEGALISIPPRWGE